MLEVGVSCGVLAVVVGRWLLVTLREGPGWTPMGAFTVVIALLG